MKRTLVLFPLLLVACDGLQPLRPPGPSQNLTSFFLRLEPDGRPYWLRCVERQTQDYVGLVSTEDGLLGIARTRPRIEGKETYRYAATWWRWSR